MDGAITCLTLLGWAGGRGRPLRISTWPAQLAVLKYDVEEHQLCMSLFLFVSGPTLLQESGV